MRPTGRLHLGHLVGVVGNWLKFQKEGECFFEIANWHALTDRTDYSNINKNILEMVIDWLSAGIDPNKSILFVQSKVPEHAEIYTLFSMVTPVSWLKRCPVYKDRTSGKHAIKNPTLGLLGYPTLQATDIAIYKGTHIPVGEDQAPHVELSRKIIRRFNNLFGDIFPEPKTILTKTPRLLGTDGRKMSKSYDNYISPTDNLEILKEKTRKMITDPQKIRKNDPGHPQVCSIYSIHNLYNPNKEGIVFECKTGTRGCVDCKKELANTLYSNFSEFRERRIFYENKTDYIKEILYEGSKKAREIARSTLDEMIEAMKLKF